MRLKSIKLAGFKSFVDPTNVQFPSNLCAIVGPNGCGKSNIIDAVRWVMGESSAKNLRGSSMADVIFNGSSARKPVGQASIELIFDNAETKLKGDLAKYSEISIRRKVIRDGTSQYFLNGTKCRRRDITDIFLGTGLGPRSYAIIEQGMISRLIEAKPEELRVYVEEAAGISKYKERRHETENRIRHTRENLERLEDIREELGKQLNTLKRQSEAAAKFKQFKEEERTLKSQVQAMQWQKLEADGETQRQAIIARELKLEASIAGQRGVDARIESSRTQLTESNDAFNEIQSRYYSIGSDIARIEQTMKYQQDRVGQLNTDLAQVSNSSKDLDADLVKDKERLQSNIDQLAELEPQLVQLESDEQQARAELEKTEAQMLSWQGQWDEFNQQAALVSQDAEVEQSRISHIEESRGSLEQRIERLEQVQSSLQGGAEEKDLSQLGGELASAELAAQQLSSKNQSRVADIEAVREQLQQLSSQLSEQRSELQSQHGTRASLEALQQAALGQQDDKGNDWLQAAGLSAAAKLGESLRVDKGWELAVETVLGDCLQAITVPSIDKYAADLGKLETGNLMLLDGQAGRSAAERKANTLSSKILSQTEVDLSGLLSGVLIADDLASALRMRSSLAAGESIITPEGVWLGANWLRLRRDNEARTGVLQRQAELESLASNIAQGEAAEQQLLANVAQANESLQELERGLALEQKSLADVIKQQGEFKAQISEKRVRLEEFALRKERASAELVENRGQLDDEAQRLDESRDKLKSALQLMQQNDASREQQLEQRDVLRGQLDKARAEAGQKKDRHHQQAIQCQTLSSEIAVLQQSIGRMSVQAEQLTERSSTLAQELEQSEQPIKQAAAQLEEKLAMRLAVEEELAASREALEAVETEMRKLDEERVAAENSTQLLRTALEEMRLKTQALKVRQEGLVEQLLETQFELKQVIDALPEEAELESWQKELERVGNRIQRLGAINLAAIEEYDQQLERKTYLDAQNDELVTALTTLENAIRKIDRETRSRFKETFDEINKGFGELFPRVFNGGQAYLEMTGDDLLDTGIAIMARPPGKRNSTIHLLSGGEKALTAIALVFAIFQLNPAPFCMLDEVDAPLDDANVGRYARMVQEMSKSIQFIYISHNKIAMEMAHQLMGVTMHEAGVSRLVSVDVDRAVELAAV